MDSRHEGDRDPTIASFRSWEPVLQPGGLVVFHDYGNPHWPGVKEAVTSLELEGEHLPYLFIWQKPAKAEPPDPDTTLANGRNNRRSKSGALNA